MQWYLYAKHPELLYPDIDADYDLTDGVTLLQFLQRTESFAHLSYKEDFQYLLENLNQALDDRLNGFDNTRYTKIIDKFMNQLGVEPFSFDNLPAEDLSTY